MNDKKFKDEKADDAKSALIGTAEYISPEMVKEGKASFAGDLWALGKRAILKRMYTISIPPWSYTILRFDSTPDYSKHNQP